MLHVGCNAVFFRLRLSPRWKTHRNKEREGHTHSNERQKKAAIAESRTDEWLRVQEVRVPMAAIEDRGGGYICTVYSGYYCCGGRAAPPGRRAG